MIGTGATCGFSDNLRDIGSTGMSAVQRQIHFDELDRFVARNLLGDENVHLDALNGIVSTSLSPVSTS